RIRVAGARRIPSLHQCAMYSRSHDSDKPRPAQLIMPRSRRDFFRRPARSATPHRLCARLQRTLPRERVSSRSTYPAAPVTHHPTATRRVATTSRAGGCHSTEVHTMATPTSESAANQPGAKKQQRKGQGQWALGHREPLNANEQQKKDDNALNVRERIKNIYQYGGFDSIDPADLRGRFRWMGLYTQRKPGIEGGRTATLTPAELEDQYFMMRVRIDGGALRTDQLRVIGEVSHTFARDSADITDRQNIQLHWIRIEDVPEIWRRFEEVGLYTTEACGDCPRVVLGSPVSGVEADEIVDSSAAVAEITERYIGDPSFANLPRKYKTAISGSPAWDVEPEINDVAFQGVVHPEQGPGFDLLVG